MAAENRQQANSGRAQLVAAAYRLFSQRGFEGVSLADIAGEVGLTKQAIIYHFRNKKALYGQVLEDLAGRYAALVAEVRAQETDPESRWSCLLRRLLQHGDEWPADAGLIARELLDNRERAGRSKKWYLREFLDDCVGLYAATAAGQASDLATRRVVVYRQIGAITYLAISEVTLGAIWGERAIADMQRAQRQMLE